MGYGKTKARQRSKNCLRGIYFIDLEDGEYIETIKNAKKKVVVLMEAALPCKMETHFLHPSR